MTVPILPSLRGLHALSALAAQGSLTAAAQELGVTRSALSHRLDELQTGLGVALIGRAGRGVALTEDGLTLLATLGDALQKIEAAVRPLQRRRATLRVSTVATFATHWLIPRLPAFQARHPDLAIAVATTTRPVDLDNEDIDCAIRHGTGSWLGLEARLLFKETLVAVAAPALGLPRAGLTGCRLIATRSRFRDWPLFWARTGQTGAMPEPALLVETRSQAIEAAIAGAGVALIDAAYLDRPLAEGRLRPLPLPTVPLEDGYWFVTRPRGRNPRAVATLRAALIAEAAARGPA